MKLRYTPNKDAKAFAPGLRPGQVLEVDREEGLRLLETGAFEPIEEPKAKQKKSKGGK